jgi:hypothetical protein
MTGAFLRMKAAILGMILKILTRRTAILAMMGNLLRRKVAILLMKLENLRRMAVRKAGWLESWRSKSRSWSGFSSS